MASVDVSALSKQQKDELACSYAAMLLHDGELEISVSKADNLLEILASLKTFCVATEHAILTPFVSVGGED